MRRRGELYGKIVYVGEVSYRKGSVHSATSRDPIKAKSHEPIPAARGRVGLRAQTINPDSIERHRGRTSDKATSS